MSSDRKIKTSKTAMYHTEQIHLSPFYGESVPIRKAEAECKTISLCTQIIIAQTPFVYLWYIDYGILY